MLKNYDAMVGAFAKNYGKHNFLMSKTLDGNLSTHVCGLFCGVYKDMDAIME